MMADRSSITDWVRPSIRRLVPYSSARDEFTAARDRMVFLDANENPFDNGVNRYPDPYHRKLRDRLSRIHGVSPGRIALGNGSDEILDLLLRIFCQPGTDRIIVCPPTYGMYKVWADINEVGLLEVPLTPDFQLDIQGLLAAVEQEGIKGVFLCSPNNPTGNLLSSLDIECLLECYHGPVVIDEAYIDFAHTDSWIKRLDQYPNLIVTQTLSKARGMAGLRLGACYANEEVIDFINRVKPPYNISVLNQGMGLELLEDEAGFEQMLSVLVEERTKVAMALQSLPWVSFVYPSDANFLLFRVDDAGKRYAQLVGQGIVLRDRSRLIHCDNCLRATIGTPEENQSFIKLAKELT